MPPLQVLALCGSLRKASLNAALLRAAARIAAPDADIEVADWLGRLPLFNPDLEAESPLAVINASSRAHHADDALRETLRTMSAGLVGERSFALPLLGAQLDEDAMAASPDVAAVVAEALAALRAEIARQAKDDIPVFPLR